MIDSEHLIRSFISYTDMSTNELEKYIEKRYKEKAPQKELNKLEDEYATRVSEEDLNMSEGISLEEQLITMYHRYITPKDRGGMEEEDIINNMRSAIELYNKGNSSHLTNNQILDAAKDLYMHKKKHLDLIKSRPR